MRVPVARRKGTLDQSTSYFNYAEPDLWVAQAGAKDMFHTFSIVPLSLTDEISWLEDGRLSEKRPSLEEKVRDPVCGMQLELKDLAYTATFQGRVFHFDRE